MINVRNVYKKLKEIKYVWLGWGEGVTVRSFEVSGAVEMTLLVVVVSKQLASISELFTRGHHHYHFFQNRQSLQKITQHNKPKNNR